MENNDIDAIYNLMQKLIDSNNHILKKLDSLVEKENATANSQLEIKIDSIIKYLVSQQSKLLAAMNEKAPSIHKEFILFGKDSPMGTKFFFVIVSIIAIAWLGFKYVSPELLNSEQDKTELQNYRMTADYFILKEFEKGKTNNSLLEIYNSIEKRESKVMKDYSDLKTKYEKSMKIKELENQINRLR